MFFIVPGCVGHFCFGGDIPIAVGMLDGFDHQAGFGGEEAQHRRRCWTRKSLIMAGDTHRLACYMPVLGFIMREEH